MHNYYGVGDTHFWILEFLPETVLASCNTWKLKMVKRRLQSKGALNSCTTNTAHFVWGQSTQRALCLSAVSMPKSFLYNSTDVTSVISKTKFMSKPPSVFWCKPRITTPKFIKLLTRAFIVKPNNQWKNWPLPSEIITLDIIYNPDGCISEFSMYIPLQIFMMTAHGIILVARIGNKERAIFP